MDRKITEVDELKQDIKGIMSNKTDKSVESTICVGYETFPKLKSSRKQARHSVQICQVSNTTILKKKTYSHSQPKMGKSKTAIQYERWKLFLWSILRLYKVIFLGKILLLNATKNSSKWLLVVNWKNGFQRSFKWEILHENVIQNKLQQHCAVNSAQCSFPI